MNCFRGAPIVLLTPGLSVIIDASKESRRIFQRMNSCAIYRIPETLRVLFFMTLAILVFKPHATSSGFASKGKGGWWRCSEKR
jgi:magnesium-transporting ATPase (P-type)